jgi:hypothetical protein
MRDRSTRAKNPEPRDHLGLIGARTGEERTIRRRLARRGRKGNTIGARVTLRAVREEIRHVPYGLYGFHPVNAFEVVVVSPKWSMTFNTTVRAIDAVVARRKLDVNRGHKVSAVRALTSHGWNSGEPKRTGEGCS